MGLYGPMNRPPVLPDSNAGSGNWSPTQSSQEEMKPQMQYPFSFSCPEADERFPNNIGLQDATI